MPRTARNTDALVADLVKRVERLIETAKGEGREEALAEVRRLVDGNTAPRQSSPGARSRAAKKATPKRNAKDGRASWWATATEAQKKERIRKMQAGRGLKPKRRS